MIFRANIEAIIVSDSGLANAVEKRLRAITGVSTAEITLSDKRKVGRIVIFDGFCAEHPDVSFIRDHILIPYNNRHDTSYQISITHGKYGGSYGKFRTAHDPIEYASFQG